MKPLLVSKIENAGQAEAVASLAINAIEASAWLLDQIEVGELGFLDTDDAPPCWWSVVAGSSSGLADTLRRVAVETIARETQTLREAVRVLHGEAPREAA